MRYVVNDGDSARGTYPGADAASDTAVGTRLSHRLALALALQKRLGMDYGIEYNYQYNTSTQAYEMSGLNIGYRKKQEDHGGEMLKSPI